VLELQESILVLLLACLLDYIVGDPPGLVHPVQVMGWIISNLTNLGIKQTQSGKLRRLLGIIIGIILVIGSGFLSWLIIQLTNYLNPWLAIGIEIILLASCFATRSLTDAAIAVIKPIQENDIEKARHELSKYVGRDTVNLSQREILRGVVETIAENTTDGVTAPLFYAILGTFIPSIGPVPFAVAYKASSTLDSMIGYLREPYTDIGWFSANLEDRLTWIPCRLTVFTLGLISGNPLGIWKICQRDAPQDPSPNSGWSESVFAAILGVQLGGKNSYQGKTIEKPLLGDPLYSLTPIMVIRALLLTHLCFLIWLSIAVILVLIYS